MTAAKMLLQVCLLEYVMSMASSCRHMLFVNAYKVIFSSLTDLGFCKSFGQNSEAMISIDMPAGPSEVLVIADKSSSARHVAADLLSQV